jgi:hypothetical protein
VSLFVAAPTSGDMADEVRRRIAEQDEYRRCSSRFWMKIGAEGYLSDRQPKFTLL